MASAKVKSAIEMVKVKNTQVLNRSDDYRPAHDALAAEEIGSGYHIVRVAKQRRAPPLRSEVMKNYRFDGNYGAIGFQTVWGQ